MRAIAARLDARFQILSASAAGLAFAMVMLLVRWKIYGLPHGFFRPIYGVLAAILALMIALLYWTPRKRLTQLPAAACAYLFLLLAFVAEFGRWFWIAELLTHFRAQIAFGLFVACVATTVTRQWLPAGISLLGLLWHLPMLASFAVAPTQPSVPEGRNIRVLVANVLFFNEEYHLFRKLIADEKPDVIAVTEFTYDWQRETESLNVEYRYRKLISTPADKVDGIAMWSKLPIRDTETRRSEPTDPLWLIARFETSGTPLTLVIGHPPNPVHPTAAVVRDRQIKEIAQFVSETKGEVIVCGDFNASPWSPIVSRFTRQSGMRDSRAGFGTHPTWPAAMPGLRTPIDYCFVSKSIAVRGFHRGANFGSDHLPIVADLTIPPLR